MTKLQIIFWTTEIHYFSLINHIFVFNWYKYILYLYLWSWFRNFDPIGCNNGDNKFDWMKKMKDMYWRKERERERKRERLTMFLLLQLFRKIRNLVKRREISHLISELNSCKSERLPKNESTIYLALSYR